MKFLTLVLGCCAAVAAQAATIELNLTGDATLAAALSAYNAANGTSYADTDNGVSLGANDVEVKGSGTLTFSTALGNWTGKLTVKSGAKARVVISQQTVLGSASTGAAYVEDGATLILDHSTNVGDNHHPTRPIHISGNGAAAGENGALKLIGNNTTFRSVTPYALYLDADATLCFGANPGSTGGSDHQFIADKGKWYLQGHKLTVTSQGWPRTNRLVFFWCLTVVSGGSGAEIDNDGVTALFRAVSFDGGAENVFRLRNGAVYQLQDTGNNLPKWTLVFEKSAGVSADLGLYQHYDILNETKRNWMGPVVLSNVLAMANNSAYTNTMGFAGKISGPGGLYVSTTQPRDQHRFNLLGAGSDFTGGLAVTNHVIHLGAPDSVPAGAQAGAMLLKDCDVRFRYDPFGKADFVFPDTVFDGSGVFGAPEGAFPQGKFKSLVKTGSGTLELRTGLTGGDVEVRGGTLKLGCGRLDDFVGAKWGQSSAFTCYVNPFTSTASTSDKQTFCSGTPIKDKALATLYTDKRTTDLGIFSASVTTDGDKAAWRNTYYQKLTTYSGYLHNRTGADLTIRLVCTINAYVHLKIGSVEKFYPKDDGLSRNAGTFAPYGNETLAIPAGTSRFEIRVYDRFGLNSTDGSSGKDFCYGNVRISGLTNWDDHHGLMWTEKPDSTDMNDYHAFTDRTDALVFATVSDYTAKTREVDALSGSGILDLDGGELTAKSVSGALRVVNGTLNVTDGLAFETGVSRLVGNVTNRAAVAGMVHGRISQPSDGPNAAAQAHFDQREILDGSVMTSLHYFYTPSSQMHSGGIFGRYPYVTYNGYLWNNTDQKQKWTVATTHDGFTRFAVNGVEYTSSYKWYAMWPNGGANGEWKEGCSTLWTDVTLKPGANKFTVYAAAQYTSAPYVGNVAFGEGTNWVDALGLAYDPENRKTFDKQYFSKFEDPGDGSLLTVCEVDEAVGCSYEKLSGVKGTVVDMNYGEAFVKDFAGVAVVSNGLLHLTGSLTMTAAEINDADSCLDGVKFLEGATFDVSDAAAGVKLSGKGRVVARHVVGDVCPALGPKLTAAGWTIALEDGEVRVFNKPGLLLFIR